ncbi:hypothetical protein ACCO45_006780 [Purpureocillium lilacinum]|uniref:Uncharacterized protein n=1 Tax=Purpureocillium lilacinum TaxID=33203 RepID=A0ACC4DR89_PURLI
MSRVWLSVLAATAAFWGHRRGEALAVLVRGDAASEAVGGPPDEAGARAGDAAGAAATGRKDTERAITLTEDIVEILGRRAHHGGAAHGAAAQRAHPRLQLHLPAGAARAGPGEAAAANNDNSDSGSGSGSGSAEEDENEAAHFVGYARTWVKFLQNHHDDEEEVLFPELAAILKDETLWGDMKKEHGAFPPLSPCSVILCHREETPTSPTSPPTPPPTPRPPPPAPLRPARPLEQHLHHEVTLLASLATHPSAPARDSFAGAVAGETLMNWGKNSVSGTFDVVPFFLLNVDRTVADDEGRWANWPPMPEPVRWGLVNGKAEGVACGAEGGGEEA